MFAITFDLTVAETEQHHAKGVSAAYADIATASRQFAFERVQGRVYVTHRDDMAKSVCGPARIESAALVPTIRKGHPWIPN